eukprot:93682_1
MALPSLEEARTAGLRDIKSGGWKYLQLLEQESVNKPRDVVLIGKQLLENNWISSSNRWRLLERVTIAALELDDKQTAADCIKELTAKFTRNSNRVRILRGMFYETKDEIKKAQDEYDFVLNPNNDSNHMMAQKRRIALLLSNRQIIDAIRALCAYLATYGSDRDGWKQLTILYCDTHCYELAKFCIEEMITMSHDNYVLFQFYAEMLYNIGGQQNVTNAFKYFSQSLLLSSDQNTRSLWGILMCIRALKDNNDLSTNDKELIRNCRVKIMKNYVDSKSQLMDTVKDVLITFGATA